MAGGRLWASLCGLAAFALLGRHLSAEEFGSLTFGLALLALLEPLGDWGTSSAALQRAAGRPAALVAALASGRKIRLVSTVCGSVILCAAAYAAGETRAPWLLAAGLLQTTRSLELSSLVFADRLEWRPPVWVRSAVAALRLLGALLLLSLGSRHFGPFLLWHAAAGSLGHVTLHRLARPALGRTRAALEAPQRLARDPGLLRAALPLALAAVAQQAYFYADNFVVRRLCDAPAVGHYNAAVRVLSLAALVAAFATQAALPWLVRRHRAGRLRAATLRLSLPLLGMGTLLAWSLAPLAEPLLVGLFGAPFAAAAPSLRWLLVALAAIHLGAPALTAVVAAGGSRALLGIVLGGLALNLVGNLAWVPGRGIAGAAMATALTEGCVAVASVLVLLRLTRESAGESTDNATEDAT